MVIESTRNGRSSVTIWMTVAPPADQPSSAATGVAMSMVARAAGRRSASR